MYKVYWTETVQAYTEEMIASWKAMCGQELDPDATKDIASSWTFAASEMTEALNFMERLRTDRRNGAPLSFITFVAEDPNQVGQAGVDSIVDGKCPDGVDYTWKKRRE